MEYWTWTTGFGSLLTLIWVIPYSLVVSHVVSQDLVVYCCCCCCDLLGDLSQSSCFFCISLFPRGGSGNPCLECISHAWSIIHKLTVGRRNLPLWIIISVHHTSWKRHEPFLPFRLNSFSLLFVVICMGCVCYVWKLPLAVNSMFLFTQSSLFVYWVLFPNLNYGIL